MPSGIRAATKWTTEGRAKRTAGGIRAAPRSAAPLPPVAHDYTDLAFVRDGERMLE
jgi:hypothetical protein